MGLFVSFLAMASSGLMMFVIEKPSFTIQMHPVHKLFGLIMIISVVAHLSFNYKGLLNHMKNRAAAWVGGGAGGDAHGPVWCGHQQPGA